MKSTNNDQDLEYRADKALSERPSFSIRLKLLLGFVLFFILSAAALLTTIITINRLEAKTHFLVIAERYTYEIQQARRFEKNYFLYQTNLRYVLDHVSQAESLMKSTSEELMNVLGENNYGILKDHLDRYNELLFQLTAIDTLEAEEKRIKMAEIEGELREHGAQMINFALRLSEIEFTSVGNMFRNAKVFPLVFSVFFLILIVYMANFLFRQINRPLSRLMEQTERIAEGDLTPIKPLRKYRDEFTNVNLALNHMMHELKRRQELMIESHKLRAIGSLTAGIAHELNNPLNNITLTAAMLVEDYGDLNDKERLELAQDLIKEAQRSERIVRNLLGFARKSEIETEHIDLSVLLKETLKLAQNQVKLKGVEVRTDIPVNLPKTHGDSQQLKQVFLNLILNAIDALDKKGLLKIKAETTAAFDYITIKFADNGCGIPSHILPSIFDPFFTTKPTRKGTGLGLSVSRGIIEEHGGSITVESEEGVGTTFLVDLPIARIPAEFR